MIYFISTNIGFVPEEIQILSSLDKIKEDLKNIKEITLDCETTGLNPIKDKTIMLQLGSLDNQYIIDTRCISLEPIRSILEDPNKLFIGHNIKFDYNMLKQFKIKLSNVYDTMLADRVIHNGKYTIDNIKKTKRYSLNGVYNYYFQERINKDLQKDFLYIKDKPFNYNHILYGALDVVYPFKIKKKQEELIKEFSLEKTVSLENKVTLIVGDIQYNGMYLNKDIWLKAVKHYKKLVDETEKKLDFLLLKEEKGKIYKLNARQQSLFGPEYESDKITVVNWNSDQQVYKILTTVFNIYPTDKYNKASASAEAISLLADSSEITTTLLNFREQQKIISSFGENFLNKYLEEDCKIRTTYNQIVDTGRMSSRTPNLQQIPSGTGFHRESFTASSPDKTLIISDYSGQEARVMSELANDENYLEFFNKGKGDAHSFVATRMFSVAFGKEFIVTKDNENKEYRQKGKILNFFISFGGSSYTLSKTLKISKEEAQELIDAFFKGFPALKKFFTKCNKFGIDKGYIRMNSITNRIRWFPEWRQYKELEAKLHKTKEDKSTLMKLKGGIERKSQNTPIQGTSSDITKTALLLLGNKLLEKEILPYNEAKVKIIGVVHDEILIEVDKNIQEEWKIILKDCMEKAGALFCTKVKLIAEPIISSYWTH